MSGTWEQAAHEVAERIWERFEATGSYGANLVTVVSTLVGDMVDDEVYRTDVDFVSLGSWALRGVMGSRTDMNALDALDRIVTLIANKQADYGHGNITKFGVFGIIVRLSDKVERLKNLTDKRDGETMFVSESIADTWDDIVGYSIIALMLITGTFGLDLASDLLAQAKAMEADQLDAEESRYAPSDNFYFEGWAETPTPTAARMADFDISENAYTSGFDDGVLAQKTLDGLGIKGLTVTLWKP